MRSHGNHVRVSVCEFVVYPTGPGVPMTVTKVITTETPDEAVTIETAVAGIITAETVSYQATATSCLELFAIFTHVHEM